MTDLITTAVPEYGLSLQDAAGIITLIADDSGSRGWPWRQGLLPVDVVGGRAHVIIAGDAKAPPYEENELFAEFQHVKRKDEVPPYALTLPTKKWPVEGQYVLLLLVFWQSPGFGAVPANGPPGNRAPKMKPKFLKEATKAINTYLLAATESDLNPGLIRQAVSHPPAAAQGQRSSQADGSQAVTFALASCQYPSDILDQMPSIMTATRGPADASLLALADRLAQADPPTLLLLAGDQVYVDATAGMFDPRILDDKYRAPYQRRGQSRGVQEVTKVFGRNPRHQLLDDHEISDNWDRGEPAQADPGSAFNRGRDAYWLYQRADKSSTLKRHKLWRDDVIHKRLPFFLADTRSQRETRTANNGASRSIMSPSQFEALKSWLSAQDAAKPKFIATSSALLPRHLSVMHDLATALHSDSWDAYPRSLHELLAYICDNEIKGLVFLSGDQHISNVVQANVSNAKTGKSCNFHSVHSSALYAPYPFANAVPEDFARFETFPFSFRKDTQYQCKVESGFAPPGDGFAVLSVKPSSVSGSSVAWQLEVTLHDETGLKHEQPLHFKIL